MDFTQKIPAYVIGGGLLIGAAVAIGIWYMALFALAGTAFVILWVLAKRQHKDRREALTASPGSMISPEVWAKTRNLPLTPSTDPLDISLVGLEQHRENWASFRKIAEVEHSGDVSVPAFLIAFKTSDAEYGMVLAYDRMVLGKVRDIEKDALFQAVWSMGGIFHVAAVFSFDSSLGPKSARFRLPKQLEPTDGVLSSPEKKAWDALWRGFRGLESN